MTFIIGFDCLTVQADGMVILPSCKILLHGCNVPVSGEVHIVLLHSRGEQLPALPLRCLAVVVVLLAARGQLHQSEMSIVTT